MDFMQLMLLWLRAFMERMKAITSFISGGFLPDKEDEDDDFGFGSLPSEKPHKKS